MEKLIPDEGLIQRLQWVMSQVNSPMAFHLEGNTDVNEIFLHLPDPYNLIWGIEESQRQQASNCYLILDDDFYYSAVKMLLEISASAYGHQKQGKTAQSKLEKKCAEILLPLLIFFEEKTGRRRGTT